MNTIFDKKRIKLTLKSPVHVGSVEQKITPFEYIHSGYYIYQISDDRLSNFLQKKKIIDSYVSAVSKDGHRFRLLEFFKSKGITLKETNLLEISGNKRAKLLGDGSSLQDRPFIRDGFGRLYIPGTSIKGVIRTAILYNVLHNYKIKEYERFRKNIIEPIEKTEKPKFKKKSPFEWIQEKWLQSFNLSDKKESPHTDWLRILHVSDAYLESYIEPIIIPIRVLKKETSSWQFKKEYSGRDTTIWVECIPEGSIFQFELIWDKALLDNFRSQNEKLLSQSLNDVFKSISKWSADVFSFEKEFAKGHLLEKWYNTNTANFRIGFGSGMTSTTITILLPDDLRKKIRNYAGHNKGNEIAPKSRRVWVKGNQPVPLGWAVMEVVD